MIVYRAMKSEDINACLSLVRAAKWNQLAADWQMFLDLSPGGCRVAENEQKVIGTVTTIKYQHFFSWIGMMLVDPDHRRKGIGKHLMQQALELLQNEATVKLDATAAGREVYLKLDFVEEYPVSRLSSQVAADRFEVIRARSLLKKDLSAVASFDHSIFGGDRSALLELIWNAAPQYAFLVEEKNDIHGYCMGRHGYQYTHIGPVIAKTSDVAKSLLSAALRGCAGKPVILDALHFDPDWLEWLNSTGFTEQRTFIRMYRGSNAYPGIPEKQFAILGPEFG